MCEYDIGDLLHNNIISSDQYNHIRKELLETCGVCDIYRFMVYSVEYIIRLKNPCSAKSGIVTHTRIVFIDETGRKIAADIQETGKLAVNLD